MNSLQYRYSGELNFEDNLCKERRMDQRLRKKDSQRNQLLEEDYKKLDRLCSITLQFVEENKKN
ncbi:unnamed protein product [Paramecium sonneborni]|uniref:Uncharacterized protein n=1 Tax=Paramecium sonneborni TaxID=65129 RepID=A0A8S1RBB5_9CILI|nr:unnamed protein product [Paramecium sonneborni]